jgi:hypothetical protein
MFTTYFSYHKNYKWCSGSHQGARFFLFFFKVYKIQTQTFQKIPKKIPWHSKGCTLSFCKFIERNTLYFSLNKNNKIARKDKIKFCVYCSSRTKSQIVYFYSAQNTTYLNLKNYTLVEYDIVYTMVFFWNFLKCLNSNFWSFSSSMELELQTSTLTI